jgi:hypothetical protein
MKAPYKSVYRSNKAAVIDTNRRLVVKVFRGVTCRRRAAEYLEALQTGWHGRVVKADRD